MNEAQAATGMDRLPWLPDEPAPPKKRNRNGDRLTWVLAVTLAVAAISYWIGAHSWQQRSQSSAPHPSTTIALPQPRTTEPPMPPQPQVVIPPPPQVSPAPVREVQIARPRVERSSNRTPSEAGADRQSESTAAEATAAAGDTVAEAKPAAKPAEKPLKLWPANQSAGADGRIVRIGAFGSRQQAKLGWRYMVRAYPAVAHLPATVVEVRNSRGRSYYRFQMGTTSQAHSEVLCQRMEKIRFSCAVVGLPWKPKGVER